jgi:DNA-binding MarR family transcriptional regulator
MHGLQIWVIDYLVKHQDEAIFQRDLEKEFVMRRPTATNLIKKMEQADLLRREAVPYDARLKKIILTEKALKRQEDLAEKAKEFEILLRGQLSDQEVSQFIATIQKIKRNIGVDDV